jgi:CBS domain-containing protein
MTVYECCRTDVVSVPSGANVLDVAVVMKDCNIGSVVVTEGEKPVGIVTDRDIVIRAVAFGKDLGSLAITEIMTRDPGVVTMKTGLLECMQLMETLGARRLPIVDEDGNLQGIITADDMIRLLAREIGCIASIIECECE